MLNRYPFGSVKILRLAVIFAAMLLLALALSLSFSRYRYATAVKLVDTEPERAEIGLQRALDLLPGKWIRLFRGDELQIARSLGRVEFQLAMHSKQRGDFLQHLQRSTDYYRHALELAENDSLSASAYASCLATRARIENSSNDEQQRQTLAAFHRALQLRPTSAATRSEFIAYLGGQQQYDEMNREVTKLIAHSPSYYKQIKKQANDSGWYSEDFHSALQRGAEQATNWPLNARRGYAILKDLSLERDDLATAKNYLVARLAVQPEKNGPWDYLSIANLALRLGDRDEAENYFLQSFQTPSNRDWALRRIASYYNKNKQDAQFHHFIKRAEKRYRLSPLADILLAQSFSRLGEQELAKSHLRRVGRGKYKGEALYNLAIIYEKEKNWDQMELAIQRATVLKPGTPSYLLKFSQSLQRQGKYERAEEIANRAIAALNKPSSGYHNHRAWLRWAQKNYQGAILDWSTAYQLRPKVAGYSYYLSLAYMKSGNPGAALQWIKIACRLKPTNKSYLKQLHAIEKRLEITKN